MLKGVMFEQLYWQKQPEGYNWIWTYDPSVFAADFLSLCYWQSLSCSRFFLLQFYNKIKNLYSKIYSSYFKIITINLALSKILHKINIKIVHFNLNKV